MEKMNRIFTSRNTLLSFIQSPVAEPVFFFLFFISSNHLMTLLLVLLGTLPRILLYFDLSSILNAGLVMEYFYMVVLVALVKDLLQTYFKT